MPIYQYKCNSCNYIFETFIQVYTVKDQLVICPKCLSSNIIKLISNVSIIFKGSGFHKNDYPSDK